MSIFFKAQKTAFFLGLFFFVLIAFLLPVPAALDQAAALKGFSGRTCMKVLGGLVLAICFWAGMVFTEWITAVALLCLWTGFAKVPFNTVFSAFSKSTFWLLVGAFILGHAITKTGLLKRISLSLMKLFPATFRGQVLALMTIGTICEPLMPSVTAKVMLGARLARSSSDLLGFQNNSRERTGLFLASWAGFDLSSPLFISASFMTYSMLNCLPEGYQTVSFLQWFIAMLPGTAFVMLATYLVIITLYHPQRSASISREELNEYLNSIGPISRNEKVTAVILFTALLMWIFETRLGISAGITAIIAGLFCFIFRVLEENEIKTGVPWGFILFAGLVLNMGEIFSATGISSWLLELVRPALNRFTNPFLIVTTIFLITTLIRFILASQTAVATLMAGVLGPIALAVGFNPFIAGLVVYTALPVWIMLYQNPTYLAALECMDKTITHTSTVKAGLLHILIALLSCLISVPYWSLLGYI